MSDKNLLLVEKIATPILEKLNLFYVDSSLENVAGNLTLTIFIDKVGGITFKDCETASLALDTVIEELDVTNGKPYHFNISSPGLNRPLQKERDFIRNINNEIEVNFHKPFAFNNKKALTGFLKEFTADDFTLTVNGEDVKIKKSLVAIATPVIKF